MATVARLRERKNVRKGLTIAERAERKAEPLNMDGTWKQERMHYGITQRFYLGFKSEVDIRDLRLELNERQFQTIYSIYESSNNGIGR